MDAEPRRSGWVDVVAFIVLPLLCMWGVSGLIAAIR